MHRVTGEINQWIGAIVPPVYSGGFFSWGIIDGNATRSNDRNVNL
jgi:hypothetical protein